MNRKKRPNKRQPKCKAKAPSFDPASLAPIATAGNFTLHSRTIGALPIINHVIDRCRLRETLDKFLPAEDGRNRISTTTAILLLVRNILISREPIYGLGEWAAAFVPELLDLREDQLKSLNDDRVGRALDRLFDADFPQLVMAITQHVVTEFDLKLSELHNDSTTVRFYGDYEEFDQSRSRRGKPTVAIRQGHSKDHRPDLKQLLYILTVTDDGGVPVYFTTDDGDTCDDTTHISTWKLLRELTGRSDFLYVADCKLASTKNLSYIDAEKGRFITILPKVRKEPRIMKQTLMDDPGSLVWELLYEVYDDYDRLSHRFRTLREEQSTSDGYRLLWIHSWSKEISDDAGRMKMIKKATDELTKLRGRLQSPRTRMRDRAKVAEAVEKILVARGLCDILAVEIIEDEEVKLKKATPGRCTEETQYTRAVRLRFDLTWQVDADALARARRADGVFPLVTNDRALTAAEVLRAYKRQPMIEKRFSQLKSDFCVAPVFLKEVSRIESLLCVYFMALMVQALMERELRASMEESEIEALPLYHEARACRCPTALRVIEAMEPISRHRLEVARNEVQDLYTDPTPLQSQLIKLFGIVDTAYGKKK